MKRFKSISIEREKPMIKNMRVQAALLTTSIALFCANPVLAAVVKEVKKVTKPVAASVQYKLDTSVSKCVWTAKKVTGSHTGNVSFKTGFFSVKDGGVTGGEIIADVNSLSNTDLTDKEYNKKIVDHLKSEDFFDVKKFPTAVFHISSVTEVMNIVAGQPNANVKGTLTLHGVTKPIETKMFMTKKDDSVEFKGKLQFDRTDYGLKFHSGKFFDVKELGDKMIYDTVDLDLDLIAKK